jgi:hypothetical protein
MYQVCCCAAPAAKATEFRISQGYSTRGQLGSQIRLITYLKLWRNDNWSWGPRANLAHRVLQERSWPRGGRLSFYMEANHLDSRLVLPTVTAPSVIHVRAISMQACELMQGFRKLLQAWHPVATQLLPLYSSAIILCRLGPRRLLVGLQARLNKADSPLRQDAQPHSDRRHRQYTRGYTRGYRVFFLHPLVDPKGLDSD